MTSVLWQEFQRSPYKHPQIPNVSFAGYRCGEHPPTRPVRADVVDFGAAPGGEADSAPAINAAIAEVGMRGGGTVLVPEGTYRIDSEIRIGWDNVVLKGAGSASTTLFAPRPLDEVVGPNLSRYGGGKSAWSWGGGLVWVCHRDRHRALLSAIKAQRWPFEGWTGNGADQGGLVTTLTEPAAQGDFWVTVKSPERLSRGQRVLLRLDDDPGFGLLRHMCGDVSGTKKYEWGDKEKLLSYRPFVWPVRIAAVTGDRVALEQPLPLDARPEWNPRITTMATPVTGSGVEGLTIRFAPAEPAEHLQDRGYNGLAFQCAWDCWARDVSVVDSDNGFLFVSAKNISLWDTSTMGRQHHHAYVCREQSHDNLVDGFRVDSRPFHGINVEGLSCGNVWSRGVMDHGTFDTHRGLPFGNVRTQITVNNDGQHGGSPDAGPLYGARFAHWGIEVTNERAGGVKIDHLAPRSATVGVSEAREFDQIDEPDFEGELESRTEPLADPPNLYHAQRRLRATG